MKEAASRVEPAAPSAGRGRGSPFFLSFVQPAIERAFAGAPPKRTPAQRRAERAALLKAAESGDADAMRRLGYLADEGLGTALDRSAAAGWYRKAAERGDARAALCLGRIHYFGQDGRTDYAEAARWYRRAADGGEPAAFANLGYMHAHGLGVARDFEAARRCLLRGAELGDSKAQSNLALIYFHQHDFAQSVRWHRAAAEQGNGPSMCNLGLIYAEGAGAPRDFAEAAKWCALGALYRKQQASDQLAALIPKLSTADWERLVAEARSAAAAGKARMHLLMAALHYEGLGVPKDAATALRWLRAAVRLGNTKGEWRLGVMHYSGYGVALDYGRAFALLLRAAWKNDMHSQLLVAECYRHGRGVRKDAREAVKWYRLAAERGSPEAQAKLAVLCEAGLGLPRDRGAAAFWSLLAGVQGEKGAAEQWSRLSAKLGTAQLDRVAREAVMRWPALSWRTPVPALERLLGMVNAALPSGRPALKESKLPGLWAPPPRRGRRRPKGAAPEGGA